MYIFGVLLGIQEIKTLLHIRSLQPKVPRLSMVDAPLCALRARELKTGAVIWGEQLSRPMALGFSWVSLLAAILINYPS